MPVKITFSPEINKLLREYCEKNGLTITYVIKNCVADLLKKEGYLK